MSEQEKEQQVGRALGRYQQAKVEAAHLEGKIAATFEAFRKVGELGSHTPATVAQGTLRFNTREAFDASALCSETTLVELLRERDQAVAALAKASEAMAALGFGDLK